MTHTAKKLTVAMFCASNVFLAAPASANSGGLSALFGQKAQKFLPVEQAFSVNVRVEGDELVASFKVTPEHYVYQDKMTLSLPEGVSASAWRFDKAPSMIDDPTFGHVAVFEEDVVARATLSGVANDAAASFRWQGCAKAGLCYPPERVPFNLTLSNTKSNGANDASTQGSGSSAQSSTKKSTQSTAPNHNQNRTQSHQAKNPSISTTTEQTAANIVQPAPTTAQSDTALTDAISTDDTAKIDEAHTSSNALTSGGESIQTDETLKMSFGTDGKAYVLNHHLERQDPFGIHDKPMLAIVFLFLAGLLLAFTPCVYPMIPIVANIVARQEGVNSKKGLLLSMSYGVGVASAYGLLGALIAWLGRTMNVIGYLQSPIVLLGFAVLFVLLGLYMFDAIKVGLPAAVRDKLQATSQSADGGLGSFGGSFVAGALSALVVSPCVSAPMAGALVAVSLSGSVPVGFFAMFALGLGLSVPLMFIGMAQGRLMPKAGAWMAKVKEFCGLLLFAVALILAERVFVSPFVLAAWALWFSLVGVWLWQLVRLPFRALSMLMLAWSACLVLGAALGSSDAWRPLAIIHQAKAVQGTRQDRHVKTLAELDAILASHDKVLIDATADWCVECRIMERELFTHRPAAMQDVQLVKFDITEVDDDSRAFLARYELMGPPALLLYKEGKLVQVLLGQTKRAEFKQALSAL